MSFMSHNTQSQTNIAIYDVHNFFKQIQDCVNIREVILSIQKCTGRCLWFAEEQSRKNLGTSSGTILVPKKSVRNKPITDTNNLQNETIPYLASASQPCILRACSNHCAISTEYIYNSLHFNNF